jgi:hypothetical protein
MFAVSVVELNYLKTSQYYELNPVLY